LSAVSGRFGSPSDSLRCLMQTEQNKVKDHLEEHLKSNGGSVNHTAIAHLVHLAPDLGSLLLDMSLFQEKVLYMNLAGTIKNTPMRCRYVEESSVTNVSSTLESEPKHDGDPSVYEVGEYHCLFPNILHIDMLQALAKTEALDIFARKSIQAIVESAWHGQVLWVMKVKLVLTTVEVTTLLLWGLTTIHGLPFDLILWTIWTNTQQTNSLAWLEDYSFPAFNQTAIWNGVKSWDGHALEPIKWNILAALNLEQFLEFLIMWYNARECINKYEKTSEGNISGDMWKPTSASWRWPLWLNFTSIHWFIRSGFLMLMMHPKIAAYPQHVMLSFTCCTSMLGMFTIFNCFASEFGLSLVAMQKTVMDREVLHFFYMLSLLFLIAMMAWMMLDRKNTFLSAVQMGWEAFLSDGRETEDISTDRDETEVHKSGSFAQESTFMVAVFVAIFITNPLMAIFSDVYSKVRKKVWVLFFHRRTIIARNCIMARPVTIPRILRLLEKRLYAAAITLVASGAFLQIGVYHQLFKLGWTFSTLSIFIWTLAIFLIKAAPFELEEKKNSWFETYCKVDAKRVLMVWCRTDFNEKVWIGSDEMKADLEKKIEK